MVEVGTWPSRTKSPSTTACACTVSRPLTYTGAAGMRPACRDSGWIAAGLILAVHSSVPMW